MDGWREEQKAGETEHQESDKRNQGDSQAPGGRETLMRGRHTEPREFR